MLDQSQEHKRQLNLFKLWSCESSESTQLGLESTLKDLITALPPSKLSSLQVWIRSCRCLYFSTAICMLTNIVDLVSITGNSLALVAPRLPLPTLLCTIYIKHPFRLSTCLLQPIKSCLLCAITWFLTFPCGGKTTGTSIPWSEILNNYKLHHMNTRVKHIRNSSVKLRSVFVGMI